MSNNDKQSKKIIKLKKKNYLYKYLKNSIKMVNLRNECSNHLRQLGDKSFYEYNVIVLGAPRQSGTTTAMHMNFNPETDYYIGLSYDIASNFIEDRVDINNGDIIHAFTEEEKKIINSRKALMTFKSSRVKEIFHKLPQGKTTIYIDSCTTCIGYKEGYNDYRVIIDQLIEYYNLYGNKEEMFSKVFVVS